MDSSQWGQEEGCHTKYCRLGDLNEKFIASQFCRLEVQDQGVSRVDSFCGLSPPPIDVRLLPVLSQGPFLCTSLCLNVLVL